MRFIAVVVLPRSSVSWSFCIHSAGTVDSRYTINGEQNLKNKLLGN